MFGFGSMSPYFTDEYLFNDDARPRRQRHEDCSRMILKQDKALAEPERCPV
jgi:hypothetical protein